MHHSMQRLTAALFALFATVASAGTVAYDLDYATFADLRGDTTHSYVEIYLRVDRWSLATTRVTHKPKGFAFLNRIPDTLSVGFIADVAVIAQSGDTLAHELHAVRQPLTGPVTGTAYDDLFTTIGMYLPPGNHTLVVFMNDENAPETASRREMPLVVRRFSREKPMLSDIELALSVARDTTGSRYAKHGLSVLPNARCIFGFGAPICYVYAEIYNLTRNARYRLTATFRDSADEFVRSIGPFEIRPRGRTSVQVKGVNVMGWVDGRYRLTLSLTDTTGAVLSARQREITVSRVPTVTPPTIRRFLSDVSWIATRRELAEFKRLSPEDKARFIQEFWRKRDPTPGTSYNEMKAEHFRRLFLADQRFGEPGLPGRDSDPGRVLIQYGRPDDIERHASSMEGRPYQIWYYNQIQGGVQFVFVDYSGSGRMTLVHSTARDEIHNSDWMRLVEPYEGTFQRRARRNEETRSRVR